MNRPNKKQAKWKDHYSRRAKKENFPARSVYKLEEMQQKYHLIKKGDKILDLGCSPGSWLLFAAKLTGNKGHVTGVDLKPVTINVPPHATIHTGDIFSFESFSESIGHEFNVVISDMAPSTTGIKNVDSARSFNLSQAALEITLKVLLPGGSFVCKIFQGEDFKLFSDSVKSNFATCNIFKPKSSRKASKEIYIIAKGKKTALNSGGKYVRSQ
ncbi:MAG: RlmE family RNA methyltransferase [Desulfobacterales bacterium]|nr:RlmE family RNA methyltransferase [Deltaproteobacteria bacterium]NNL42978.1 RlmE family RNA methyltransferase [Desulfobacterales bacterium]